MRFIMRLLEANDGKLAVGTRSDGPGPVRALAGSQSLALFQLV